MSESRILIKMTLWIFGQIFGQIPILLIKKNEHHLCVLWCGFLKMTCFVNNLINLLIQYNDKAMQNVAWNILFKVSYKLIIHVCWKKVVPSTWIINKEEQC